MSDAVALTQAGVAELNAQRPEAAAAQFLAALRLDLRQEQSWLGLALALALQGKLGDLVGLADYRQRVLGDGFLFFHGAAGMLVGYRLYDHARGLARLLPGSSPYRLPAFYAAGCAAPCCRATRMPASRPSPASSRKRPGAPPSCRSGRKVRSTSPGARPRC